jgi:predicted DNA-binding WGR domain protein
VYLERHDDNDNMHRFYQMFVTPGLFDDWSLIKEWFDCEEAAVIAGQKIKNNKVKKGYQLR